jgi:hypothetical protein
MWRPKDLSLSSANKALIQSEAIGIKYNIIKEDKVLLDRYEHKKQEVLEEYN